MDISPRDIHVIDGLINTRLSGVSEELFEFDNNTLVYLEQLIKEYDKPWDGAKIEKYKRMLELFHDLEGTKIYRDIKQCVHNLEMKNYKKELDSSEEILEKDMMYIQMLTAHNGQ